MCKILKMYIVAAIVFNPNILPFCGNVLFFPSAGWRVGSSPAPPASSKTPKRSVPVTGLRCGRRGTCPSPEKAEARRPLLQTCEPHTPTLMDV